jgi:2-C-methyl-D-erythritol 4-phosphate cytidylyltransferase
MASRLQCIAIVPCGGSGARFGGEIPKQYIELAGATVLEHTLRALRACDAIEHIFVVVPADEERADAIAARVGGSTVLRCAGPQRADTVSNALAAIARLVKRDAWVLVHDAARPCVSVESIDCLIHIAGGADSVGGLLALPVTDSLKRATKDGAHVESIPREGIWRAQTPQMFRYETLAHALASSPDVTDESAAIEALGLHPVLVHGDPRNIKITIAEDALMAELFLNDARAIE